MRGDRPRRREAHGGGTGRGDEARITRRRTHLRAEHRVRADGIVLVVVAEGRLERRLPIKVRRGVVEPALAAAAERGAHACRRAGRARRRLGHPAVDHAARVRSGGTRHLPQAVLGARKAHLWRRACPRPREALRFGGLRVQLLPIRRHLDRRHGIQPVLQPHLALLIDRLPDRHVACVGLEHVGARLRRRHGVQAALHTGTGPGLCVRAAARSGASGAGAATARRRGAAAHNSLTDSAERYGFIRVSQLVVCKFSMPRMWSRPARELLPPSAAKLASPAAGSATFSRHNPFPDDSQREPPSRIRRTLVGRAGGLRWWSLELHSHVRR